MLSFFPPQHAHAADRRQILFLGDSLTDGYTLGKSFSYPTLIQNKIDKQGLDYDVINGGISGDTAQQALRRLSHIKSEQIDIFVVALGANDAFQQLPIEATEAALTQILSEVKTWNSSTKLIIAGIKPLLPTSQSYEQALAEAYLRLSRNFGAILLPNLLHGVQGVAELHLSDNLHPNAKGHEVMAKLVWETLQPLLTEKIEPN